MNMYYIPLIELQYPPNTPTYNEGKSTLSRKEKPHSTASTRKSSSDSIEQSGKFKTELCKYYAMRLECPFNQLCNFAHGEEELRSKDGLPMKYKTKPCSKFSQEGYCPYGLRCQFIHSHKKDIIDYEKIMDKIRTDSQVFFEYLSSQKHSKARRLSFFQQFEGQNEGKPLSDGYEPKYYNISELGFGGKARHYSI